jgi:hypothetical protein
MPSGPTRSDAAPASTADITEILGALNESDLLEIAALQPSIRDLEEAATWLSGDRDIFGAGVPLQDVVAEIVAVLVRDTEDEAERAR